MSLRQWWSVWYGKLEDARMSGFVGNGQPSLWRPSAVFPVYMWLRCPGPLFGV